MAYYNAAVAERERERMPLIGPSVCRRTLALLHATWCVNSVAHWFGDRPYSRDTSARNSFLTALITGGEGYHNFHHRFPSDYRNAVRWYQYDPTKWFIWTMNRLGFARSLKRASDEQISAAAAS